MIHFDLEPEVIEVRVLEKYLRERAATIRNDWPGSTAAEAGAQELHRVLRWIECGAPSNWDGVSRGSENRGGERDG